MSRLPFGLSCSFDVPLEMWSDRRQDTYVAIMGSIKVFGGKKHVSATHIRSVKDHNEVYNHLLKALYVTLSLRNPGGGVSYNCSMGRIQLTTGWSGTGSDRRLRCRRSWWSGRLIKLRSPSPYSEENHGDRGGG